MIINMAGSFIPATDNPYDVTILSLTNVLNLATYRTVTCSFTPYSIYGYTKLDRSGARTVHGCVKEGSVTPQSPSGWGCNQYSLSAKTKSVYTFNANSVRFQPYDDSSQGGNLFVKVFGKRE